MTNKFFDANYIVSDSYIYITFDLNKRLSWTKSLYCKILTAYTTQVYL